jgi:hypothetical protein
MTDYSGTNGVQVKVDTDRKIATVHMFLNGEYVAWVEYNPEQLNGLIKELKQARDELNDVYSIDTTSE